MKRTVLRRRSAKLIAFIALYMLSVTGSAFADLINNVSGFTAYSQVNKGLPGIQVIDFSQSSVGGTATADIPGTLFSSKTTSDLFTSGTSALFTEAFDLSRGGSVAGGELDLADGGILIVFTPSSNVSYAFTADLSGSNGTIEVESVLMFFNGDVVSDFDEETAATDPSPSLSVNSTGSLAGGYTYMWSVHAITKNYSFVRTAAPDSGATAQGSVSLSFAACDSCVPPSCPTCKLALVPEPSSLALVLAGLAVMIAAKVLSTPSRRTPGNREGISSFLSS